jgi:hypothetical protein
MTMKNLIQQEQTERTERKNPSLIPLFPPVQRLKDLGSTLELPPGWKLRVKVLDEDLTIRAVNGIAHIVQDDLENTYDLCAGGSSNFKP